MSNRINLLHPAASRQSPKPPEGPAKWLVIACLVLMIITVGTYVVILGLDINARNSLRGASGGDAVPENAATGEIESLLAEKERTVANINRLKAEKPRLTVYIDELLKTMPASLVLTGLEIKDKPFEVTLKGIAASHFYVAQFGRNLQESEHFRSAVISSSEKRVKENLFEYVITVTPERKGGTAGATFIDR